MKKRIVPAFLALTLMLSLAIPAFAAQYVSDGYYGGSYYEIVDNCTYDMFSGTITCMDRTVYVAATVKYANSDYEVKTSYFSRPAQSGQSTTSGYIIGQILNVYFEHYIDGNVARNNTMYPS